MQQDLHSRTSVVCYCNKRRTTRGIGNQTLILSGRGRVPLVLSVGEGVPLVLSREGGYFQSCFSGDGRTPSLIWGRTLWSCLGYPLPLDRTRGYTRPPPQAEAGQDMLGQDQGIPPPPPPVDRQTHLRNAGGKCRCRNVFGTFPRCNTDVQ